MVVLDGFDALIQTRTLPMFLPVNFAPRLLLCFTNVHIQYTQYSSMKYDLSRGPRGILRNVRRYACATLLLAKGVHPKFVQALLGHASIGITMDLYRVFLPIP